MRLTLAATLEHPTLVAARPRVLAGGAGLQRRVRWVHSSEVLEIAPLLRGGELLLTGGEMLGAALPAVHRRYVRELAERHVAGVAIQTGPQLPAVPASLLDEAERLGFPVIELRSRVPFVGVAEAVNAELVNDSVTMLQSGGELAHALSGILGEGGGLQAVLDELVRRAGVPAALLDSAGQVIAHAGSAEQLDTPGRSHVARHHPWCPCGHTGSASGQGHRPRPARGDRRARGRGDCSRVDAAESALRTGCGGQRTCPAGFQSSRAAPTDPASRLCGGLFAGCGCRGDRAPRRRHRRGPARAFGPVAQTRPDRDGPR